MAESLAAEKGLSGEEKGGTLYFPHLLRHLSLVVSSRCGVNLSIMGSRVTLIEL